jgi:hypothetical protein
MGSSSIFIFVFPAVARTGGLDSNGCASAGQRGKPLIGKGFFIKRAETARNQLEI